MKKIALGLVGLCMTSAAFAETRIAAHCWEEKGSSKSPESMAGIFAGSVPNNSVLKFFSKKKNKAFYNLTVGTSCHPQQLTVNQCGMTDFFQVEAMVTQMVTQTQTCKTKKSHKNQSQGQFQAQGQFQGQFQQQAQCAPAKTEQVEVPTLVASMIDLEAPSEWTGMIKKACHEQAQKQSCGQEQAQKQSCGQEQAQQSQCSQTQVAQQDLGCQSQDQGQAQGCTQQAGQVAQQDQACSTQVSCEQDQDFAQGCSAQQAGQVAQQDQACQTQSNCGQEQGVEQGCSTAQASSSSVHVKLADGKHCLTETASANVAVNETKVIEFLKPFSKIHVKCSITNLGDIY
jgi:hypothetical protein